METKTITALAVSLMITGCATTTPTIITAECPSPPQIERPKMQVLELNETSTPGDVIMSHRVDIKALQGYAEQLEELLEAYRK